jgi:hypothetical protein
MKFTFSAKDILYGVFCRCYLKSSSDKENKRKHLLFSNEIRKLNQDLDVIALFKHMRNLKIMMKLLLD